MDDDNSLRKDNDDEIIIRVNIALSKPDKDVSLMSTFNVRYNGTRNNTAPIQFDPISQIGIVLPN